MTRCTPYENVPFVQEQNKLTFGSPVDSEWHKAGASQMSWNFTHINKSGYSSLDFLGQLDSLTDWQIVLTIKYINYKLYVLKWLAIEL